MKLRRTLLTAALLSAVIVPLLGHHSIKASYDAGKETTITGVLTEVVWRNPHSWLYMNAKGPDGKSETWHIEIGAPNALTRAGIPKEMFKLNDSYTVNIWPALTETSKDFKTVAGRRITFSDGHQINIEDNWGESMLVPAAGK